MKPKVLFKIKYHTTPTMSLHAKHNGLLKTNATNLKSYSITSSLVHLVIVQVWVLVHPQGSTYWPTTLHMKSLTFKKSLFNMVFQASKPKGEKGAFKSCPFLVHSSKEIPFLQLVLLAKR